MHIKKRTATFCCRFQFQWSRWKEDDLLASVEGRKGPGQTTPSRRTVLKAEVQGAAALAVERRRERSERDAGGSRAAGRDASGSLAAGRDAGQKVSDHGNEMANPRLVHP